MSNHTKSIAHELRIHLRAAKLNLQGAQKKVDLIKDPDLQSQVDSILLEVNESINYLNGKLGKESG